MSNTDIARQLTLSPLTVKTHVNHAMTKLAHATARNSLYSPTRPAWPRTTSPAVSCRAAATTIPDVIVGHLRR